MEGSLHFDRFLEAGNGTVTDPGSACGEDSGESPLWWAGVIMSIASSILSNFGANIQKYSLMQEAKRPANGQRPYVMQPLWGLGLAAITVGSIGDFVALGFAAQSLLTPVGGFTMVANVFFASMWLGEKLSKSDIVGTGFIVVAVIIIALFAAKGGGCFTLEELMDLYTQPLFIVYAVLVVLGIGACYHYSKKVEKIAAAHGVWGPEYAPWKTFHSVVYPAMAGGIGAQSVLFAKSFAELVSMSISGDNQMDKGVTYVILAFMFGTIFCQLHYLATALKRFDAVFVVPVFQCTFISVSIVGGGVYFQEFSTMSTVQACMFCLGITILMVGIFKLTQRSMNEPPPKLRMYSMFFMYLIRSRRLARRKAQGNGRIDSHQAAGDMGSRVEERRTWVLVPSAEAAALPTLEEWFKQGRPEKSTGKTVGNPVGYASADAPVASSAVQPEVDATIPADAPVWPEPGFSFRARYEKKGSQVDEWNGDGVANNQKLVNGDDPEHNGCGEVMTPDLPLERAPEGQTYVLQVEYCSVDVDQFGVDVTVKALSLQDLETMVASTAPELGTSTATSPAALVGEVDMKTSVRDEGIDTAPFYAKKWYNWAAAHEAAQYTTQAPATGKRKSRRASAYAPRVSGVAGRGSVFGLAALNETPTASPSRPKARRHTSVALTSPRPHRGSNSAPSSTQRPTIEPLSGAAAAGIAGAGAAGRSRAATAVGRDTEATLDVLERVRHLREARETQRYRRRASLAPLPSGAAMSAGLDGIGAMFKTALRPLTRAVGGVMGGAASEKRSHSGSADSAGAMSIDSGYSARGRSGTGQVMEAVVEDGEGEEDEA